MKCLRCGKPIDQPPYTVIRSNEGAYQGIYCGDCWAVASNEWPEGLMPDYRVQAVTLCPTHS